MTITAITRDQGINVSIVRITTTNTLAQVAVSGYITAQTDTITALNNGEWTWLNDDVVLVSASDGHEFFQFTAGDFATLVLMSTAGNGAVTLPVVSGNFTVFDGTLGALKDAGYSPSDATKTKVVMAGSAVQVNYIAHFVDTSGTIDDTAANIQNDGNIQAGKSGTAGTLISFPSVATSGSLILAAVTNGSGNFNTTISNAAAVGQSQVISIPDAGSATANFIISKSAGTQHITTGSLQVDAGDITAGSSGNAGTLTSFPSTAANGSLIIAALDAGANFNTTIRNSLMGQSSVISIPDPGQATSKFLLTDSAGTQTIATGSLALTVGNVTATAGNLQAGSSGHAGTVSSFPGTAANGSLILAGVNAGGNFTTTISNGTMGQSTVYTMGDIGAATGGLVVATSAIRMKSVAQAAVAGGAAAQTVTDAFCTAGSSVIAVWNDTTNPVTIQKVAAGAGSFVVTSSGDPGASHLNYIIIK